MGQEAWSIGWGPGKGTSWEGGSHSRHLGTQGHQALQYGNRHFANVLRRQLCGVHIFQTFESFLQEGPLLPMSDVVPQGPPSDVVEKVVIGMGCLFQAFLNVGSGGRQDG